MRTWKNTVEAAWEALSKDVQTGPMADRVKRCETCRHYLGDGHCNVNLELECRDGGHEAWEPKGR